MKPMLPAVGLLMIAAACSPVRSARHHFDVIEEEGVPTAVTRGGPRYDRPVFAFEFVCRLEQDESRPETLLSGAVLPQAPTLLDEAGYIYASDFGNNCVLVFDPDGRYRHTIGRQGHGPGEFFGPQVMAAGNGEVCVLSGMVGARRLSFFRPDGNLIRVEMLRRTAMNTFAVYPAGEGRTVHVANDYIFENGSPVPARRIAVISAEDDTLGMVEQPLAGEYLPFQTIPFCSYLPGRGIIAGETGDPVLRWYDLEGRLTGRIRLEVPRDPVTEEERQAIRATAQARLQAAADDRQRRSIQERMNLPIPREKDYWSGVYSDETGFLWTQNPGDRWNFELAAQRFRIFSPEGEYLGDQHLPEFDTGYGALQLSRGHLLLRYLDRETGAPVVEVYRLRPAVPWIEMP